MGHPAVLEAAVVAVPHPRWLERPVAAVVLRDGRAATAAELLAFLGDRFPRWWLPDDVVFVPAIPRTSTGKFLKSALRDTPSRALYPMNPLLDLSARPVIAHRGASGYAPENTLAAFELAAKQGADAFELDVRLTRDGAPVVVHDETLDRTTNLAGPVRAKTLAELRQADAGFRFTPDRGATTPYRGAGSQMPTLAEVLWAFPGDAGDDRGEGAGGAGGRAAGAARGAGMRPLRRGVRARRSAEGLPRGAVRLRRRGGGDLGALLVVPAPPRPGRRRGTARSRCRSATAGCRFRRGCSCRAARRLGCPVHVWTVNDSATARRLWARGVAGIVTNVPDVILATRS